MPDERDWANQILEDDLEIAADFLQEELPTNLRAVFPHVLPPEGYQSPVLLVSSTNYIDDRGDLERTVLLEQIFFAHDEEIPPENFCKSLDSALEQFRRVAREVPEGALELLERGVHFVWETVPEAGYIMRTVSLTDVFGMAAEDTANEDSQAQPEPDAPEIPVPKKAAEWSLPLPHIVRSLKYH